MLMSEKNLAYDFVQKKFQRVYEKTRDGTSDLDHKYLLLSSHQLDLQNSTQHRLLEESWNNIKKSVQSTELIILT
jgi:hypothetical protein